MTEELHRLLQDLEIVEFDIHRLASRRVAQGNWKGWTAKARDMGGIHRQLDDLYEKKRYIVMRIESLARSHANTYAESKLVTGGVAWRGTGVGIYEATLEMAQRDSRGDYQLIDSIRGRKDG